MIIFQVHNSQLCVWASQNSTQYISRCSFTLDALFPSFAKKNATFCLQKIISFKCLDFLFAQNLTHKFNQTRDNFSGFSEFAIIATL